MPQKIFLPLLLSCPSYLPKMLTKKLEARNFVFSSMEDFQNALTLHEAIIEGAESQVAVKRQAETHADLWKVHHELYALLDFYSTQAAESHVRGDLIEETANVLNEEYN
jgi:hypothetical protein